MSVRVHSFRRDRFTAVPLKCPARFEAPLTILLSPVRFPSCLSLSCGLRLPSEESARTHACRCPFDISVCSILDRVSTGMSLLHGPPKYVALSRTASLFFLPCPTIFRPHMFGSVSLTYTSYTLVHILSQLPRIVPPLVTWCPHIVISLPSSLSSFHTSVLLSSASCRLYDRSGHMCAVSVSLHHWTPAAWIPGPSSGRAAPAKPTNGHGFDEHNRPTNPIGLS